MSKKPYHHGNLEETLIEAGLTLVDQNGLENLSLRRAAAACGVSHAAPYKHFADKEQFVSAMQNYLEERFTEVLTTAYDTAGEPGDAMACMAQAYLEFFLANPHYFSFFQHQQAAGRINLNNLEAASDYRPFEVFKSAALRDLAHLPLNNTGRDETIIAMWAVVHGITSLAVMNGVRYDGSWSTLLLSILNNNLCAGGNHFEKI